MRGGCRSALRTASDVTPSAWYHHDTADFDDAFHSSVLGGSGELLVFRLQIMELLI